MELVELFVAAGLFVGAALQPVARMTVASVRSSKVGFMYFNFPACHQSHIAGDSSNGGSVAKFISSALELR